MQGKKQKQGIALARMTHTVVYLLITNIIVLELREAATKLFFRSGMFTKKILFFVASLIYVIL